MKGAWKQSGVAAVADHIGHHGGAGSRSPAFVRHRMKGAWKQSGGSAVADHIGHLGGAGFVGRARPVRLCLYGLALTFAGFTVFLAFAPTLPVPPASSPAAAWFDGLIVSASPYRTQVSGFLSSLFPANSTSTVPPGGVAARRAGPSGGWGFAASGFRGNGSSADAVRPGEQLGSGGGVQPSSVGEGKAPSPSGKEAPVPGDAATAAVPSGAPPDDHVQGGAEAKHSDGSAAAEAKGGEPGPGLASGGSAQNGTSAKGGVPVRINGSDDTNASSVDAGDGNGIGNMASCDTFYGNWVRDDSYPLYPAGSCPHVDESFNCHLNGRPDKAYERLRWQPSGCRIPRLNPTDMLERLRGKRLVFVGDSLNRNMWESLICILRNSVKDKSKVFEVSGRSQFRAEGSYSFLFQDYNCSVEFFYSPFLVQEWEMPIANGKGTRETLRLDIIDSAFPRYKNADIIIFNTGHWWTHEKTSLGKDYYQEGDRVYSELDVHDAFRRALNTWAKWVDSNANPKKTTVFFRGYSASHFSGGQWNSGGSCDKETEPIVNDQYLTPYPTKMSILEEVLHGMKTPVVYLNITRMTDYRKEAHPSVYRKQKLTEEERKSPELYQDCSHWCLPGVPDSWNELLYAQILLEQQHTMQQ
ncbi:protein trichome birefringence-like 1 [Miscanthus floridulus]|uniref:protein trichome birefringence-like 1 n=1 Tax=Miscanthus floridulus TaxID=154761 RepID=UPI00345A717B